MTALAHIVDRTHDSAPDRVDSLRAKIAYQPALDGVRALAVTMVLFFHGGVKWMRGGYFGVSVFFTLSGFLITALLLTEFESTKRIAPGAFYARRAKRLLPASLVCLSAVSLLAMSNAWTQASHLKRDLFGALAQVANWVRLFAGESYVDAQTRTAGLRSPLDHYWSLAIEDAGVVGDQRRLRLRARRCSCL
jgi:peptidoglycan/LPS O-acetylase OafA/YrhL